MDFAKIKAIAYSSQHYMDDDRLQCLFDVAQSLQMSGDVVECGVAAGCSATVLAAAMLSSDRKLWLYDSWETMPPPEAPDGHHAMEVARLIGGKLSDVRAKMQVLEFPDERLICRRGWFAETLREPLPPQIALLHIDCDWYRGIWECLDALYDRVISGGIIVLDDFGYFEGVVRAFYDFCRQRSIYPLLQPTGRWQALWVKDKLHNRDSYPFEA